MVERYGNVRVSKVRAAYKELRDAVRKGDLDSADKALDRYEPWADYVFSKQFLVRQPIETAPKDGMIKPEGDTPERMWVENGIMWHTLASGIEYLRKDIADEQAQAMVAASLDRAVQKCRSEVEGALKAKCEPQAMGALWCKKSIAQITPPDAQAALDRVVAEAVRAEREACDKAVQSNLDKDASEDAQVAIISAVEAIRNRGKS